MFRTYLSSAGYAHSFHGTEFSLANKKLTFKTIHPGRSGRLCGKIQLQVNNLSGRADRLADAEVKPVAGPAAGEAGNTFLSDKANVIFT